MAIGDDAAAAGMPLVNGNAAGSAPEIDDYINETRDFIAQRTSAVTPVAKGGTGSTTADAARATLGITASNIPTAGGDVQTDLNYLAGLIAGKASQADLNYVQQGNMTTDVYNRILSGSYHVAYVDSSGRLGWVPSSRRLKKNITPVDIDVQAVLSMELVTFLYKVEVDTERLGELQHGLIAEDLDDLGLDWLVDYGTDGQPEGVRYDRLALALLPVLQEQARTLAALTERVAAIEARDA